MGVEIVDAHDMGSLQTDRVHMEPLNFLDAFVNSGNAAGQQLKTIVHM